MSRGFFEGQTYLADAPADQNHSINTVDAAYCNQRVKRAGLLMEEGDLKEAEDCLRQALDRVPHHAECRAYYAVCLAARKRKFVTAEKLAKNILKDHPNHPTAWYALGRINLLGGRRSQAFQNFEKARRVSGNDAGVEILVKQEDPRQGPTFPFLSRDNALNILFGRIRAMLGG